LSEVEVDLAHLQPNLHGTPGAVETHYSCGQEHAVIRSTHRCDVFSACLLEKFFSFLFSEGAQGRFVTRIYIEVSITIRRISRTRCTLAKMPTSLIFPPACGKMIMRNDKTIEIAA
jgi:hypothetical protein